MTTKKADESKGKKSGSEQSRKPSDSKYGAERAFANPFESIMKSWQEMAAQTVARTTGQSPKSIMEFWQQTPEMMEQTGKAGTYLKDLREVAGLTHEDLARAIDLENPELLKAMEEGRSPITLDILYRLASFHSRNDPMVFLLDYSREHAPFLWYTLRLSGMDKFLITIEREVKFVNIYRSRDAAREMDNEQFDKLMAFMQKAFDLALDFIADETDAADAASDASDNHRKENAKPSNETAGSTRTKAK